MPETARGQWIFTGSAPVGRLDSILGAGGSHDEVVITQSTTTHQCLQQLLQREEAYEVGPNEVVTTQSTTSVSTATAAEGRRIRGGSHDEVTVIQNNASHKSLQQLLQSSERLAGVRQRYTLLKKICTGFVSQRNSRPSLSKCCLKPSVNTEVSQRGALKSLVTVL